MERRWAAPIIAFAVAAQSLAAIAALSGQKVFSADTWARYDSGHYLAIARGGYELFPCDDGTGNWCGNATWFPGLPWLMRTIGEVTGMPLLTAGVLLSWLFALGTLLVLWRTFLRDTPVVAAGAALALAAFWPGEVYYYAVFPLSMLTFFTVLWLWWLGRGRWLASGLAGAGMAVSYHLGPLASPIAAAFAFLATRGEPARARVRAIAQAALPPLAMSFLVLVVMRVQAGDWTAYFKIQDKYATGTQTPFQSLYDRIKPIFEGPTDLLGETASWQALLVLVIMVALIAALVARRRAVTRAEWLVAAVVLLFWLAPLTRAGSISYWRAEATLLPAAILARHLPAGVAVALAGAAFWVAMLLARAFFEVRIV